MNMRKEEESIIRKQAARWYQRLPFSRETDAEFYQLVEQAPLEKLDLSRPLEDLLRLKDYGLNLIYFLAACEEMYQAYCKRGIPQEIFDASVRGLVLETQLCKRDYGTIGVYEAAWFYEVINRCNIMRIGCLQFEMYTVEQPLSGGGLSVGDKVLSVHIPWYEPLSAEACCCAMEDAERFFMRYFPKFDFSCFICDSWMLDESIDIYLGEKSNIRAFRKLFNIYHSAEADAAIKFVMGRTVTRDNIASVIPTTGLQRKLQKHVTEGGSLYCCCGRRECVVKTLRNMQ